MGRVKGNKDGEFYLASLIGKEKKNFPNLKETKALVLVSIIGNEYCEGVYLQSSVSQAIDEFGAVTVLIADEVYWHNLSGNDDDDSISQLKSTAVSLGDKFLKTNLPFLAKAVGIPGKEYVTSCKDFQLNEIMSWIAEKALEKGIKLEMVRWRDWVNSTSDNFSAIKEELTDYYTKIDSLKDSIEITAKEFAKRHRHEDSEALWIRRSTGYLLEEAPAVMWCAAQRNFAFIAYPGDYFLPFKETKDFFCNEHALIEDERHRIMHDPNLVGNWLNINFKRTLGHVITNIDPRSVSIAASRLSLFSQSKSFLDKHITGEAEFIEGLTAFILHDETIDPDIRIPVLITALEKIHQSRELDFETADVCKDVRI